MSWSSNNLWVIGNRDSISDIHPDWITRLPLTQSTAIFFLYLPLPLYGAFHLATYLTAVSFEWWQRFIDQLRHTASEISYFKWFPLLLYFHFESWLLNCTLEVQSVKSGPKEKNNFLADGWFSDIKVSASSLATAQSDHKFQYHVVFFLNLLGRGCDSMRADRSKWASCEAWTLSTFIPFSSNGMTVGDSNKSNLIFQLINS